MVVAEKLRSNPVAVAQAKIVHPKTLYRNSDYNRTGFIIFDLPSVTLTYGPKENGDMVKLRLGLELNSRDDIPGVQYRLTNILNRVVNDLRNAQPNQLRATDRLNGLRRKIHRNVQDAAGTTRIEGVVFKEIIVF